jgi:hypothetical protein
MSESLLFTELLHVRIDGHWNLLVVIASWLAEGHAYLLDFCNSTDVFSTSTPHSGSVTSLYFTGAIALFQTVLPGSVSFLILRKYIVSLLCSLRSKYFHAQGIQKLSTT